MASNQLVFNDEADPIAVESSGDEGMDDKSPRSPPRNSRQVTFAGVPEEVPGDVSDKPSPWKKPKNRGTKRRRGKNALVNIDGVDAGASGEKPGATDVSPGSPKHVNMPPKSGSKVIRTIRRGSASYEDLEEGRLFVGAPAGHMSFSMGHDPVHGEFAPLWRCLGEGFKPEQRPSTAEADLRCQHYVRYPEDENVANQTNYN